VKRCGSWLVVVAALAAVAAGCGGTQTETVTVTAPVTESGLQPPSQRTEFGHIVSLRQTGDHYTMRFDPALLLSGETANEAAAEDGVVEPGEPVPNDNYVLDESHRLLTYPVANDATVTVLTSGGAETKTISVAELAQALQGKGDTTMWDPRTTGTWITTDVDTVIAIRQQYHP
jgi:hypothetical protein